MEIEKDEELLRNESLKIEDNFSSHTHSIETLTAELGEFGRAGDFPIPQRYNVNTLVLLPVNVRTNFIYWEISEDYIKNIYNGPYEGFVLKAIEKQEGGEKDLTNVKVQGEVGSYYLNYYIPNRSIYISLGVVDRMGKFIPLLSSNTIYTPSDLVNTGDEVWMSKMSDWMEIIHASLERISLGGSSEGLTKEMELLKRQRKLKVDVDVSNVRPDVSSHEFLGSSEMLGGSEIWSSFHIAGSGHHVAGSGHHSKKVDESKDK